MNIPDHISESLVQFFGLKIFEFFVSSVLQIQSPMIFGFWIWDHGWKNPDLGINIPEQWVGLFLTSANKEWS
jgi:hypothetical protein